MESRVGWLAAGWSQLGLGESGIAWLGISVIEDGMVQQRREWDGWTRRGVLGGLGLALLGSLAVAQESAGPPAAPMDGVADGAGIFGNGLLSRAGLVDRLGRMPGRNYVVTLADMRGVVPDDYAEHLARHWLAAGPGLVLVVDAAAAGRSEGLGIAGVDPRGFSRDRMRAAFAAAGKDQAAGIAAALAAVVDAAKAQEPSAVPGSRPVFVQLAGVFFIGTLLFYAYHWIAERLEERSRGKFRPARSRPTKGN
jgi:hypothetical protein